MVFVFNWLILGAENGGAFCVKLMCWTEGGVELRENSSNFYAWFFLNSFEIVMYYDQEISSHIIYTKIVKISMAISTL